jgi:hypothetical protein
MFSNMVTLPQDPGDQAGGTLGVEARQRAFHGGEGLGLVEQTGHPLREAFAGFVVTNHNRGAFLSKVSGVAHLITAGPSV